MSGAGDPSRARGGQPVPDGAERRSRLRQYQVQLLERMQAAKSGAAVGGRELGVLIGGQRFLLDLTQISEIVSLQALTAVPLAQPWYQGLSNIRGNLTGIVDLALYHTPYGHDGQAAAPATAADGRYVTFAPALSFNCALRVERVLGLRNLGDMERVAPAGDALVETPPWCRQQFSDADARRWTRIDLSLLVREARFLQVGL
ncbi:chemotaxis protein CheW [Rugamonas sp.]|uniref:chemotaxis protein CheW n=1 Tax=Rugamonas sp. TaxID=1926287 RepID=UPI0025E147D7|nr:chemotaxis protein CheW [Rugamonas sp.]